MAQTFTLDQLIIEQTVLTREPGQNVKAVMFYSLTDVTGGFLQQGKRYAPQTLPPGIQTSLNQMWDQGVNQIKIIEGLP